MLPPTPDGLLKFCVDVSFKNTSLDSSSGQQISAPPDSSHQDQHNVPESLKKECQRVITGIFGKELAGSQFESFRICWYVRSSMKKKCISYSIGTASPQTKISSSQTIHAVKTFPSPLEALSMAGNSYQLLGNMLFRCLMVC